MSRLFIHKHCAKSGFYAIYNVRGITLTTLVVTIVVLLILASVAVYSGIEAIDNTKRTKFIAELKIMQSYVNQWYEDCKPNNIENWENNISTKFSGSGAIQIKDDANNSSETTVIIEKAQTTLNAANIPTANYNNFYYLSSSTLETLGVEGVSQDVLVSIQDRKVVSYLGLKYKNVMYYTIDSIDGENGIDAIYNVEFDESILKPDESRPEITVTGRSVYFGDTAKNAKYKFTVDVTQGSRYINKGELYYGKIENGNVKNWNRTEDKSFIVDRDGTYKIYYKDAAGNESEKIDYVIEPKATLIDGLSFNKKMKTLSGTTSPDVSTYNTNITEIKMSLTRPASSILVDNNKVSTASSQVPVYMWFDNGTIWLWSEENWFKMHGESSNMFRSLSSLNNINLKNFDSSSVVSMSSIFYGLTLKNLDLSSFNTNNVQNMSYMFLGCSELETLDLSNFNTQNVTNMQQMFLGCTKLTSLDLSSFNTSNVTYMYAMFYNCQSLKDLNVSSFNTQNVTNMSGMFLYCTELDGLDLSNFNTEKVTDMSSMFMGCRKLKNYNIKSFNTEKVKKMNMMFDACNSITSLDLSHFNTSNVESMYGMFYDCSNLENLDIHSFNTSNVTNMQQMFNYCRKIKILDLSSFDTSKVTQMYKMFSYSVELQKIYVSESFVTTALTNDNVMSGETIIGTNSSNLFDSCTSLVGGDGTAYSSSNPTDKTYARIDYIDTEHPENSTPGYFTRKTN